ncbi:MAG TPA: YbaK/EbsC family protein, partial [Candidatus Paceibacterota bacterium]|nr:YbaK/EbsC family protein [Candidatus Paceibacterota bacterium]
MDSVFTYLNNLGITCKLLTHEAVFTVEESKNIRFDVDFGENKNLFLRNKKGDKHFLVTIAAEKRLDLERFARLTGESKVGFASPKRLKEYLDLTPGSVSPFGLINDMNHQVIYVLDADLLKHETLGFHPNVN